MPVQPPRVGDSTNLLLKKLVTATEGITGGGGGAVSSVFGRAGAVVAATGDYTKEQITGLKVSDSPQFAGLTGVLTIPGAFIRTPAAIVLVANAGTLTVTNSYSSVTLTANSVLTPSAAGTNGQTCSVRVTNGGASSFTLTMNNSGTDYVTTIPVGSVWVTYISDGTDWIPTIGSPASGTIASTSLIYFSNPTTRVDSTAIVSDLATIVRTGIVEKIAVFSVDGGGSAISGSTTVAIAGTARVPFACTLTGVSITATGATGNNTVKFWRRATGTTIPTIADNINTSGISLTTGTAVLDTNMADFSGGVAPVFAAGDMVRALPFAVDGTSTDLTVTLYGTRL